MLTSILLVAFSLALGQETKPDPREKLDTAIAEGIRLLEAKEAASFIKLFAHPDDLKRMLDKGKTLDEIASGFAAEKATRLAEVFKEIKDKMPEMSEDGTQAIFKTDLKGAPGGRIVFQKSGKLWYIRN